MFPYLKWGKNVENAFEEAMVSSVHSSCEFWWIGLLLKTTEMCTAEFAFSLAGKMCALKEQSVIGTQQTDLKCNERDNVTRCNQVDMESSVTFRDVLLPLCSPQLPH